MNKRKVNLKIFKSKLIDVKLCLSHYLRNQFLRWTTYNFFTSLNSCSTWIHDILMKKVADVFLYITGTVCSFSNQYYPMFGLIGTLPRMHQHSQKVHKNLFNVLANQWVTGFNGRTAWITLSALTSWPELFHPRDTLG